jgi:ectoine hydroxylase-related dioxygenase (phytanoyl-CoA dioxygenase family)
LSLDKVEKESCVKFISGSHLWNKLYKPKKFKSLNDYDSFKNDEKFNSLDELDLSAFEHLSWEIEPGDCIVFHGKTIHGALGNMSNTHRRRAFATRWLGDDIRYSTDRPGLK